MAESDLVCPCFEHCMVVCWALHGWPFSAVCMPTRSLVCQKGKCSRTVCSNDALNMGAGRSMKMVRPIKNN